MNQNFYNLYAFLKATCGNWRNAVFLQCPSCPYRQPVSCKGFLMAIQADGNPILVPCDAIRQLSGEDIEPNDCILVLDRQVFEAVYSLYLKWNTVSGVRCSLRQLSSSNQHDYSL